MGIVHIDNRMVGVIEEGESQVKKQVVDQILEWIANLTITERAGFGRFGYVDAELTGVLETNESISFTVTLKKTVPTVKTKEA